MREGGRGKVSTQWKKVSRVFPHNGNLFRRGFPRCGKTCDRPGLSEGATGKPGGGEGGAPPIASSKIFPPMVVSMVEVGEETGALPDMLTKIADSYDDDIDNAVGAMTSIIEPILIIFLAVVVGTIVVALFMPLISIMQTLS